MPDPQIVHITDAIHRAVTYLEASQSPNGEFPTYWSLSRNMSFPTYGGSPFITGMILLALSSLGNEAPAIIRRRGIDYLRTKRKENSYFAFFDQGIDCDLDDICLLNWLLQSEDSDQARYKALAEKIAGFPQRAGFYETWIRNDPNADNNVDPCVNVNVVRFLAYNGIRCDRTIQALRETLHSGTYVRGTFYYESGYALPYLIFTLPQSLRDAIVGVELQQLRLPRLGPERPPFPIDIAMKLFIMSMCKRDILTCSTLASDLLAREKPNGGWPSWAAFKAFNFWGSAELTTAIVAQALWHYRTLLL